MKLLEPRDVVVGCVMFSLGGGLGIAVEGCQHEHTKVMLRACWAKEDTAQVILSNYIEAIGEKDR